jgi:1-aminocyclopropane-1-carboxylate deaminase/D-cysteine desulfhydrase-like pyridoxal-dependent ACC family enzyme
MSLLSYQAGRLFTLPLPEAEAHGVSVWVVREDLNHPFVSGNKWWKLQLNLEAAIQSGYHQLLTFGGAYSNHIFATAAAAKEVGLRSVGIIRGERVTNNTLRFGESCGMRLHFVSRSEYRQKKDASFLEALLAQFGPSYVLPEGGTNALAVKSCAAWGQALWQHYQPDVLCVPVGTGGTLAGLVAGFAGRGHIIGFAALKGAEFLTGEVSELIHEATGNTYTNWHLETAYHGGGYGKISAELIRFIAAVEETYALPLDPVYTAKMVTGIRAMITEKKFRPGTRIFVLHTGGLQGAATSSNTLVPNHPA